MCLKLNLTEERLEKAVRAAKRRIEERERLREIIPMEKNDDNAEQELSDTEDLPANERQPRQSPQTQGGTE